ncbi:hypothetical protein [Thauera butanivorans]|uniref:hypothetical protein n=1 Tax=Thauera butanivorans TaxID=86174 RepID=UPI0008385E7B|nr:hypothetical protein [Thauera butanivorans]
MDPNPDTRQQRQARRLHALLLTCALGHWRDTLEDWIREYEALDHVVDDERDGPRAAVIALLRSMASMAARPNDLEFATLLSGLDFLNYRILRTPAGHRPSIDEAEPWDPASSSLRAFCADRSYDPAGYRSASPQVSPEATVRHLLRALQKRKQ